MHMLADGSNSFISNIGGMLQGASELLLALGAGAGFLIRLRRSSKREKQRTATAAQTAAQETRTKLEAQLEKAHADQITSQDKEIADLKAQNALLLKRILGDNPDDQH